MMNIIIFLLIIVFGIFLLYIVSKNFWKNEKKTNILGKGEKYEKKKKNDKKEKEILNIKNSGSLLLRKNPGGKVGVINYSFETLSFEIYPDGIIFYPFLFGSIFCIKKEDIIDVKYKRGLFFIKHTVIKHNSPNIDGKIVLYCEIDKSLLLKSEPEKTDHPSAELSFSSGRQKPKKGDYSPFG